MRPHLFALAFVVAAGCSIFGDTDEVLLNGGDGGMDGGDGGSTGELDGGSDNQMSGPDATNVGETNQPDTLPDCRAQVLAADVTVEWTTPNTMYIRWSRVNPEVLVRQYEMLVGRTSVDVEDEVNVRRYTADDNGEFRRTTGEFPVTWTVATGLEPNRDYFVKLIAFDQDWCSSTSNIASGVTLPDVSNEHVIFSESPTAGWSVPAGVTFSNRHPYEGQFHYEWHVDCNGEDVCFDIVRRGGFDQPIDFDPAAFDQAFLEFAWHNEGSHFAQYPAVRIAITPPSTEDTIFWKAESRAPTGPSADYRLFQVPLRFFWAEGSRDDMTAEDVAGSISEFGVVAQNEDGTYVNWDEVRIRW